MERNSTREYKQPYKSQPGNQVILWQSQIQHQAALKPGKSTNMQPQRRHRLKSGLLAGILVLAIMVFTPFVIVQLINNTNESRIFTSLPATPARPVAIVFGAGLQRNGNPSWMLADRLDSAIELYRAGKVQRLLMTGDNVTSQEVNSMRNYAISHGVPADRILADDAGLRTYDSCYRAAHNFGLTRAILVTQVYHLPRALYLCNALGVESVGFKAGREDYPNQEYYNSREFMATFLSWVDVTITHPQPEISRQNS